MKRFALGALIVLSAAAIAAAVWVVFAPKPAVAPTVAVPPPAAQPAETEAATETAAAPPLEYPDPYDSPQQFMEGIYAADRTVEAPDGYRIRAMIVPHHLAAAATAASGIKMLERQTFKRILLLAPDHFDACPTLLCTIDAVFKTELGEVRSASGTVALLRSSPLVTEDAELFKKEHGVSAVLPFIAHYLPGVPVTPLVVSQKLPWKGEKDALTELLARAVDEDTLLAVSGDFSHYLPLGAADSMDEQTAETIFAKDLDGIAALKQPDQTDCAACLWLLASLADRGGFYNPSVAAHTNSARLLKDEKAAETTSHFAMVWYANSALDGGDLAVAGDMTVTRGVPRSLPKTVLDWWSGSGPRLVNLEGPLAASCSPNDNPFMFCNLLSRWERVKGLATLFGVMNNHMLDLGSAGLAKNVELIKAGGKTPVTSKAFDDGRYRIFALTELMNPVPEAAAARLSASEKEVLAALADKKPGELTVVYVHGGDEYSALAAEVWTARWEKFIDAGADAVVAVHAHEPGDVFIYKGKPIFRGLGNFMFDQYDRNPTSTAKMARLRKSDGAVSFETLTAR